MPAEDSSTTSRHRIVGPEHAGMRLDVFLSAEFPQHSRTRLRRAICEGAVTVSGDHVRPAHRLRGHERVEIVLPTESREGPVPEDVPLEVLYEDDCLVVVNKPPRMVVHPAKGHWSGTLTSALAFHFEQLSSVGGPTRPGIVHRLDRDTSGVIVVAKTDEAHGRLARQFEARTVDKEYFAITCGVPDRDRDEIDQPIGLHPRQREKMAIRAGHHTTRDARTFYEVVERFDGFAAFKVFPKTGRTHQIRVHLAHIGCPVLCDRLYGGRTEITRGEIRRQPVDEHVLLDRPALHARRIRLLHPTSGEPIEVTAPLPEDITEVLHELQRYRAVA